MHKNNWNKYLYIKQKVANKSRGFESQTCHQVALFVVVIVMLFLNKVLVKLCKNFLGGRGSNPVSMNYSAAVSPKTEAANKRRGGNKIKKMFDEKKTGMSWIRNWDDKKLRPPLKFFFFTKA